MKKALIWLLVLTTLMLSLSSACAATTVNTSDRYSDAPANPTQDNIMEITSTAIDPDGNSGPFALLKMMPTDLTVDNLGPIYDFVEVDKNPPARYFPEEVQRTIMEIGLNPDALYMPEFVSLFPQIYPNALKNQISVRVEMLYDIDYLTNLSEPDYELMAADLAFARSLETDLIAVIMHWGVEYQTTQNRYQENRKALLWLWWAGTAKRASGGGRFRPIFRRTATCISPFRQICLKSSTVRKPCLRC